MSSSENTTLSNRPTHDLPTDLPPNAGRAATGIAIVLVAQLMLVLDATVVNVALPRIDTDLGFGPASLSWVLNAYTLAFGGLLLLGGRLGDVRGRLRMFEIGLSIFTLFSLLGGLAQTPNQLVLARALQGAGAAMAAPSVLALLTTSAPDEAARNRALALFGAVSSAGASIGLLLGGVVTDLGSWRWTLWINVPIGIAVLVLARRFVTETPRRPGRFDVVGAVTATLGAVAIVWSLIGTPEHGWLSVRTITGFAVGILLLLVLARTEVRHPHPLVQPHLVRNTPPRRRPGHDVAGDRSELLDVLPGRPVRPAGARLRPVRDRRGLPALQPRRVRDVADHAAADLVLGARTMVMIGAGAMVVGYLWLSQLSTATTYWGSVFGPVLIAGLATGFIFMPITATVLGGVEPEHAGSASGLLQTTQQLGAAVGVAAIVSVYATGAVPGQFVPGVQPAFLTSAAFSLAAFSWSRRWLRTRPPAASRSPSRLEPELAEAA